MTTALDNIENTFANSGAVLIYCQFNCQQIQADDEPTHPFVALVCAAEPGNRIGRIQLCYGPFAGPVGGLRRAC